MARNVRCLLFQKIICSAGEYVSNTQEMVGICYTGDAVVEIINTTGDAFERLIRRRILLSVLSPSTSHRKISASASSGPDMDHRLRSGGQTDALPPGPELTDA